MDGSNVHFRDRARARRVASADGRSRGAVAALLSAMDTLLDLFEASVTRFGDRNALGLRTRRRHDLALELPRARPAQPPGGVAPARARAGARRPAPHLVALDARPPGRVLRGDAGTAGPRPARPAHVDRCDREHRPEVRPRSSSSSAPAATRRIRATRTSNGSRRRPSDDLTADPDDSFPADWEAQLAAWERLDPTRSGS